MIKEALKYLVCLGIPTITKIDGQQVSDRQLHVLKEPTANAIQVNSLSGLVEYLRSGFDTNQTLMVHVVSPTEVVAFNSVNSNCSRGQFVKAEAMVPSFCFDNFYDAESFNIKAQSCFVANEDKEIVLKVVGNITEDQVQTYSDDGISQSVTAKVGVANRATVVVPNPVALRPFRTFVEVEQPESSFVFRMKNGPACALFEADGGAWKLEAMQNIKAYLVESLNDEIFNEKVIIIA